MLLESRTTGGYVSTAIVDPFVLEAIKFLLQILGMPSVDRDEGEKSAPRRVLVPLPRDRLS